MNQTKAYNFITKRGDKMSIRDPKIKPNKKTWTFPKPWECPRCRTIHSPYKMSCKCKVKINGENDISQHQEYSITR